MGIDTTQGKQPDLQAFWNQAGMYWKKVKTGTSQMLEHNQGLFPWTWKGQKSMVRPRESDKFKSNSGHFSVARRIRRRKIDNMLLEPAPHVPDAIISTLCGLIHPVLTTPHEVDSVIISIS